MFKGSLIPSLLYWIHSAKIPTSSIRLLRLASVGFCWSVIVFVLLYWVLAEGLANRLVAPFQNPAVNWNQQGAAENLQQDKTSLWASYQSFN